ncbi:MAG TPA: hypothetical protein VM577_15320 [Anaerovoracaceae bacterium]|nr:hypothetical protein [Anaerovoracaceae bacterium]
MSVLDTYLHDEYKDCKSLLEEFDTYKKLEKLKQEENSVESDIEELKRKINKLELSVRKLKRQKDGLNALYRENRRAVGKAIHSDIVKIFSSIPMMVEISEHCVHPRYVFLDVQHVMPEPAHFYSNLILKTFQEEAAKANISLTIEQSWDTKMTSMENIETGEDVILYRDSFTCAVFVDGNCLYALIHEEPYSRTEEQAPTSLTNPLVVCDAIAQVYEQIKEKIELEKAVKTPLLPASLKKIKI